LEMSFLVGLGIFIGGIVAIIGLYALWWYLFDYSKVKIVFSEQAPDDFKAMLNNCKVVKNGFRPILLAPEKVSQTIGVAIKRSRPKITIDRELLALDDGGQVGLDWFKLSSYDHTKIQRNIRDLSRRGIFVTLPENEDDRPVCVIVHGVNGGSNENYIRHFGHALMLDPMMRGCRVVVMVCRGLCGVPMTTPRPYNAGYTEDLRVSIKHIHERFPNAPLLLAGFSLGANLVCRYICEEKGNKSVLAALSVNNPFDLQASTIDMETQQGFIGRYFSANIAKGLIRYTRKNEEAFRKSPYKLDFNAIYSAKLCSEFDEHGSSKMFGLAHNTDYYREYSSLPMLRELINEVETPLLFISTKNDPMCTDKARNASQELILNAGPKARVGLAMADNGGHLGFLETTSYADMFSFEHSWVDRAGCDYFSSALDTYAPLNQ